MNWHRTSDGRVPKNQLLLVTSGTSWRREDVVLVDEGDAELARTSLLKGAGQVLLVYWRKNQDLPEKLRSEAGGVWMQFPSNAPCKEPFEFEWWTPFQNPVQQDDLPDRHLASPFVPNLETLTPFKEKTHFKPSDPRFLN